MTLNYRPVLWGISNLPNWTSTSVTGVGAGRAKFELGWIFTLSLCMWIKASEHTKSHWFQAELSVFCIDRFTRTHVQNFTGQYSTEKFWDQNQATSLPTNHDPALKNNISYNHIAPSGVHLSIPQSCCTSNILFSQLSIFWSLHDCHRSEIDKWKVYLDRNALVR